MACQSRRTALNTQPRTPSAETITQHVSISTPKNVYEVLHRARLKLGQTPTALHWLQDLGRLDRPLPPGAAQEADEPNAIGCCNVDCFDDSYTISLGLAADPAAAPNPTLAPGPALAPAGAVDAAPVPASSAEATLPETLPPTTAPPTPVVRTSQATAAAALPAKPGAASPAGVAMPSSGDDERPELTPQPVLSPVPADGAAALAECLCGDPPYSSLRFENSSIGMHTTLQNPVPDVRHRLHSPDATCVSTFAHA